MSRPLVISILRKGKSAGFSLFELLTVIAIATTLAGLALLGMQGLKTSRDIDKAAYDIQGVLEEARTLAMATETYTWVGFFEQSPGSPGTAGTGEVVMAVVSSGDGTRLYSALNPTTQTFLAPTGLGQAARMVRIPNVHLDVLSAASVPRPSVPSATYQVGSSSFASQCNFQYPIGANPPTYTFRNIIEFNPQGDAIRIADLPTKVIELGLRPTHGTTISSSSADLAAIQIMGIGGHVTTYLP